MADSTNTHESSKHSGIVVEQFSRYESGQFNEDAAEIIAHDPERDHLFVVNAELGGVDVLDITSPTDPERIDQLVVSDIWADAGEVTNIAVHGSVSIDDEKRETGEEAIQTSVLAVAVVNENPQAEGRAVFYDTSTRSPLTTVAVGAVPDMVTYTPDGQQVLTANAGEPSEDYEIVPPGTVSVVDLSSGVVNATERRVDFTTYDGREDSLRERGVRIFGPESNPDTSPALCPEYLTVSADGTTAYVVCQINNAFAVLDIETATVTDIHSFGYKDHAATGNELDASNVDRLTLRNWPIYGMYQPDAITSYTVDGQEYLLTANEGGMCDYEGYSEVTTVSDLTLDPSAFDLSDVSGIESVSDLQRPEHLGKLLTTTELGDRDGDGCHEDIYCFGGRSFSIWKPDGTLVYDSGADFELLVAMHHPEHFNTDGLENTPFSKSTVKGPEPEGIAVGEIENRAFAFIGLERIGSLVVYDITDPSSPLFVQYLNNRNFALDPLEDVGNGDAEVGDVGDLGPEGVTFIPAEVSTTGKPLVAVGNELSGTTTLYQVHILIED
jgi:hypothetical protein